MDWEKLFEDYLGAVYSGDHIVAGNAIDDLREPEQREIAQKLWDEFNEGVRHALDKQVG
jgi:hypothetical protein